MERVLGSLKLIEPEKNILFDTMEFTRSQNSGETYQEKAFYFGIRKKPPNKT